jgi:hypothetical protein
MTATINQESQLRIRAQQFAPMLIQSILKREVKFYINKEKGSKTKLCGHKNIFEF